MSRSIRVIADDVPYHITQRGNHKQDVFDSDADRLLFLRSLLNDCSRWDIKILGFCLMSNHVHLIAEPHVGAKLSTGLKVIFRRHALYMNMRRRTVGHLWEKPFFSNELDEPALWCALRYVELNPVAAGLVSRAEDWPWSSARAHTGGTDVFGLLDDRRWHSEFDQTRWQKWLSSPTVSDAVDNERLLEATALRQP